jgi:hypothetical protein
MLIVPGQARRQRQRVRARPTRDVAHPPGAQHRSSEGVSRRCCALSVASAAELSTSSRVCTREWSRGVRSREHPRRSWLGRSCPVPRAVARVPALGSDLRESGQPQRRPISRRRVPASLGGPSLILKWGRMQQTVCPLPSLFLPSFTTTLSTPPPTFPFSTHPPVSLYRVFVLSLSPLICFLPRWSSLASSETAPSTFASPFAALACAAPLLFPSCRVARRAQSHTRVSPVPTLVPIRL